ncbi:YjgN family protein [Microvirga yunnanensis]|uniref:YjgN family protein n=1 Tax=Microvirga yunnanensis TaxID=2953740 RepID=UPI0021CA8EFD|nr:YjgN family protein [Microvirga sp. HBU65207]
MTLPLLADGPAPAPSRSPMAFSGRGREFMNLLIAGSLFQIPTFGFYRFWLITRLRRHLWAHTEIAGEAFEYTGTARELLIGFLIALAILGPLYIAYAILGILLEETYAFASVPLVVIMYVLAHFGSYRARKYRASRTVFRGIRFWMTGSGWPYATWAILWDVAMVLTLGLALPWALASLERYRMRNTYFGSIRGDFAGTGWGLFKRVWWIWLVGFAGLLGLALLVVVLTFLSPGRRALEAMAVLLTLLGMALFPLALAIVTRWRVEGLRFGDVTTASRLRARTCYGLFVKLVFSALGFLLAFVITVGLVGFLAARVVKDVVMASGALSWLSVGVGLVVAVGYLVALLGLGILQRYFLGRGLWVAVVASTTITNLESIDRAVAAGQPAGVLGEGLADALDFNVGL